MKKLLTLLLVLNITAIASIFSFSHYFNSLQAAPGGNLQSCYVGSKNNQYESYRWCGDCRFHRIKTTGDGACRKALADH